MSDEELIARLRHWNWWLCTSDVRGGAADRIEALVKERDEANEIINKQSALLCDAYGADLDWDEVLKQRADHECKARAERLEEALQWCSGSDDFQEGGVARKGWLKVCAPLLIGEART